jgi:probable HAF family extracellular repeat protein
MAIGINDTGSVVGHYYDNAGNAHGFLETGGEYVTIDDPFAGTKGTFPKEVNNHGQVVGVYYDQTGAQHAFIYDAGSYVTVDNPLGVKGTLAYGINDSGQIVGYFKDADGNAHGFASGPANVTPQDIQSANLTILRVGIDDQSATSLANAMNSGSVIAANYISGLARSAANTSAAVLSISELMGMHPESQTLDDETHFVASANAQFGVANGWIQLGAAIAQLSSSFQSEYANLNQDDFINAITSKVFGASSNTELLRSELSVYEAYFSDGAGGADPTAELRARGAFAADMLHQASDYAATHAGSSSAAFQQASEAFLVGLVEGTKQYGDSIFA